MWHLVKGLCEIHNDHICLSVTPVLSSVQARTLYRVSLVQVTNHVMKELNQLGFARPLSTEAMLVVSLSTNIFEGKMLVNVANHRGLYARVV